MRASTILKDRIVSMQKTKNGKRSTIHNFIEDSHLEFQLQFPDVLTNSTQSQDRHH